MKIRIAVPLVALVLAGCGSSHSAPGGGTPGSGAPAPASGSSRADTAAPAAPSGSGSSSGASATAGTNCSSAHLALQIGGSSPAAGTQITHVMLRNAGSAPCRLQGFPGASFLDESAHPVGPAAARTGGAGSPITLAPTQVASAELRSPLSTCTEDSPEAEALRIFPPGERGPLQTFLQVRICGTSTINSLVAGTGSTPAGPSAPGSHPVDAATCSSTHLALTVSPPQAAAGSLFNDLVLRNAGTTSCSLSGFPGVSLLDSGFHQLGVPAAHDGPPGSRITLAPGAVAHAVLQTSAGACTGPVTRSAFVRVFPPGERGPLLNPLAAPPCGTPRIRALAPGTQPS